MSIGQKECKPWGSHTLLSNDRLGDTEIKTKILEVDANSQLSLQSHEYRFEVMVVVDGECEIQLEGATIKFSSSSPHKDRYALIPPKAKHRIITGDSKCTLYEFQFGTECDESDIKRFGDIYGRC